MSYSGSKLKKSTFKRAMIIIMTILFALAAFVGFLAIADRVTCSNIRVVPSYAMDEAGLDELLSKDLSQWTEEDYSFAYSQTGLTKVYFDDVGRLDKSFIKSCQSGLFYDEQPDSDAALGLISHDYYSDKYFSMVPLRAGDVIVSSSVHMFGWPMGHAGLVISPTLTIQAMSVGALSLTQPTSWFRQAANFIVLRPTISEEEAKAVADWARENLIGLEYSFMTGVFGDKDQTASPRTTQCAHIVWQAYKALGYDVDATGGPVVTPRNLANSDLFEVVQVNGLDLEKLWS